MHSKDPGALLIRETLILETIGTLCDQRVRHMSSTEHETTVFRNVRVFDGESPLLSPRSDVLIRAPQSSPSRLSRSRKTAANVDWKSTAVDRF
jgi:hypothetical protein